MVGPFRHFVFAFAVVLIASTSIAFYWTKSGESSTQDRFAAIAYSQSSGRWGASWNWSSRDEAQNRALAECNQSDGKIVVWVRNGYCALATGSVRGAYGIGWASTAEHATEHAMSGCNSRTSGCKLVICVPPLVTPDDDDPDEPDGMKRRTASGVLE